MDSDNNLLQPSLTTAQGGPVALYSAQAGYITSFFGGPVAAIAMAAVNSNRVGRLSRDLPLFLAGAIVFMGAAWWLIAGGGEALLLAQIGKRASRISFSAMGLLYFLVAYLVHRRHYRNMELMGLESPNGFRMGLICFAIGVVSLVVVRLAFQTG